MVGLYGFWCRKNGRCIYIGKAKEQPIRERLLQHWKGSHNETLNLWIEAFGNYLDICYLPISRQNIIDKMETELIRKWNPEADKSRRRR